MLTRKYSNNHYLVKNNLLKADIRIDPFDAVVSVKILKIKGSAETQHIALKGFIKFLKEYVGGNLLISAPTELPLASEAPAAKFIDYSALQVALAKQNERLATEHKLISPSNYSLLQSKEEYQQHTYELFNLRRNNYTSQFVNSTLKNMSNEYVKHFALYDKVNKQFVASLQVFMHHDYIYLYNYSNTAAAPYEVGQLLLQLVLAQLQTYAIQGIWFLNTADNKAIYDHLFHNILACEDLDNNLQQKLGIAISLNPAQSFLQTAANNIINNEYNSDKKTSTNKLGLFANSTLRESVANRANRLYTAALAPFHKKL